MKEKEFYSLTDSLKNEVALQSEVVSLTALSEALKTKAEELEGQIGLKPDEAPVDGKAYTRKDGAWSDLAVETLPLANRVATISNPNLLINGDFSVWQRGITHTDLSVLTYTADRWQVLGFKNSSRQTHLATSIATKVKTLMGLIPSASDNIKVLEQIIENGAYLLNDQTVTVSFITAKDLLTVFFQRLEFLGDKDNKVLVAALTFLESPILEGTTWKRVSITLKVPALAIEDTSPNLRLRFVWKAEITPDIYTWISEVKLELGPNATPFIPDDPATNLEKCQRYYIKSDNIYFACSGQLDTKPSGLGFMQVDFPVTMRSLPTVTINPDSSTTFSGIRPYHHGFVVENVNSTVSNNVARTIGYTADSEL